MNLTQHFTLEEFNKENLSIGTVRLLNLIQLALFLELVRARFGHPIIITSGYRSIEHNCQVGGVANSRHLYCKAVDITCSPKYDFSNLVWCVDTTLKPDGGKALHYEFMDPFLSIPDIDPNQSFYYEFHAQRRYIHIQFGSSNTDLLNIFPYLPFGSLPYDKQKS